MRAVRFTMLRPTARGWEGKGAVRMQFGVSDCVTRRGIDVATAVALACISRPW